MRGSALRGLTTGASRTEIADAQGRRSYSEPRATIGSRRAARRAGLTPAITPVSSATRKEIRPATTETSTASPNELSTTTAATAPIRTPRDAARGAEQHRFGQELAADVSGLRPYRHPESDLADPLAHREQHDVRDPDRAHDQRNERDGKQQRRHGPAGPFERGRELPQGGALQVRNVGGEGFGHLRVKGPLPSTSDALGS